MPDTVAPYFMSTTPAAYSNQVIPLNGDFMFEMSEAVKAGSGNITISAGTTVVATIPVTSSAVRYVGKYVIVTPPVTFLQGQSYTVSVSYGAIVDLAGNAAVDSMYRTLDVTLNFTAGAADTQAPVLTSTRAVVNNTIGFTFNEAVLRGTGNITVHNLDGSVAFEVSVTDTEHVYVVGQLVYLINRPDLDPTKMYYVTIDSTAFTDYSNNPFAGVSSPTVLPVPGDTQAPGLTNISPYYHFANIPIDAPIVLTYSENVQAGSGAIVLASSDGSFVDRIDITDTTQVTIVGNTVTIQPTAALSYLTYYTVTVPAGIVQDLAGNPCANPQTTDFATMADTSDHAPPVIASSSPTDNEADAAFKPTITLTFNEPIKVGSGIIRLYNSNGILLAQADVANSEMVAFTGGYLGNTVQIKFGVTLAPDQDVYVQIDQGAFLDQAGNGFAGIASPTALNFTVGNTVPTLVSAHTGSGGSMLRADDSIVLTFNEPVTAGMGNQFMLINTYWEPLNGNIETRYLEVGSQVTFSGNTVTLHPTTPFTNGAQYAVVIGSVAITDLAGNYFAGIPSTDPLHFQVEDTVAPVLFGTAPADDMSAVPVGSNITLNFDETVVAGSGTIEIRKSSDGSLVESFSVTNTSRVTFAGKDVAINPGSDLAPSTGYYVILSAGAVQDLSGNSFAGITSPTALNFTTSAVTTPATTNTTQPITVNEPVTVGPGETVNITFGATDTPVLLDGYDLQDRFGTIPRPDNTPPSLFNFGTINVAETLSTSAYGMVYGVRSGALNATGSFVYSVFWNAPGGVLNVSGRDGAYGYSGSGISSEVRNDGTITVTSTNGMAWGVYHLEQAFVNTGQITVTGATGGAGVYPGPSFDNSGTIYVATTSGRALGVIPLTTATWGADGGQVVVSTLKNSGTITVVGSADMPSVGVAFSNFTLTNIAFENSGTINADYAFVEFQMLATEQIASQTIVNSGTVNGDFLLGLGDDTVTSSGRINGDIDMGDAVDSVTNSGRIEGNVFLGTGDDVFAGGSGILNGAIYGDVGDDTITLGGGDAVVDGGAGNDTVIFAGALGAYTISYDGAKTIVSGAAGNNTLMHVENLVFSDQTVYPSTPEGLIINIVYDASVANAPAGFKTGIEAVVRELESMFTDRVTITIAVGYGEVNGNPLDAGALGESYTLVIPSAYDATRAALIADASSVADLQAVATLPATRPMDFYSIPELNLSAAEAKALGLSTSYYYSPQNPDGYIGFSSGVTFDFNSADGIATGAYDFASVVAHEIAHVMGRETGNGAFVSTYYVYSLLDLFHYSAPGVRTWSGTTPGYFSIDSGTTNLNNFNTDDTGTFSDWAASAGNDAFVAFAGTGTAYTVTPTDVTELDVLGWNLAGSEVHGGSNDDICNFFSGVTIDGGAGNDRLTLYRTAMTANAGMVFAPGSLAPAALPDGTSFVNVEHLSLVTGSGNDSVTFNQPYYDDRWGGNAWNGGAGIDTATVNLGTDIGGVRTFIDGSGAYHIQQRANGARDTVVLSNVEKFVITGGGGNDTLVGGHGIDTLFGGTGDDLIQAGDEHDVLCGGLGNNVLDGGANIDTAIFSGNYAAYTTTQTSTGNFTISGLDGTDTLTNIEFAQFDDKTIRLLPGTGTVIDWNADPSAYMAGIRDFDGNDLGAASGWKLIGTADVNGDGSVEHILVNRQNGRWAEVSTEADGRSYFANNGWAGDTRIVGTYIDPLVASGEVVAGSDFDSQRRFQNDLNIENIHSVLGQADYNHDGLQEIYFSLTDGTAYLHAYMHADGNIQYANYQNESQVKDYLTANGFTATTWAGWFPAAQAPLAAIAGG